MTTIIQPLPRIYLLTSFLLPLCSAIDSPLHRHAHLPRQAVTVTETATAPGLTSTAIATETATSTPSTAPSNPGGGPTSSPIIFFIVLALGIILIIIGSFFIIYCIKKRRAAAREDLAAAAAAPRQGHELQSTSAPVGAGGMQTQPTPAQEVYGYYAPVLAPAYAPGLVTEIDVREEAARGKREVYG